MKNGRTKDDSKGNCAAENEKANAAKENMGAFCKKPLGKQLRSQFFYKNIPIFCLAVFAALAAGSLNLILSWIIQQLMDTAAGKSGALSFRALLLISAGFVLLCAGLSLLNYASQPRFLERAMQQYKDFAFKKLIGKSISSFRDESAAGYLSALTNDAASIETNYLAQMLAMITKAVTFIGALLLMCKPLKAGFPNGTENSPPHSAIASQGLPLLKTSKRSGRFFTCLRRATKPLSMKNSRDGALKRSSE